MTSGRIYVGSLTQMPQKKWTGAASSPIAASVEEAKLALAEEKMSGTPVSAKPPADAIGGGSGAWPGEGTKMRYVQQVCSLRIKTSSHGWVNKCFDEAPKRNTRTKFAACAQTTEVALGQWMPSGSIKKR